VGLGPPKAAGESEELVGVYRLRIAGGTGTPRIQSSGTMKKRSRLCLILFFIKSSALDLRSTASFFGMFDKSNRKDLRSFRNADVGSTRDGKHAVTYRSVIERFRNEGMPSFLYFPCFWRGKRSANE